MKNAAECAARLEVLLKNVAPETDARSAEALDPIAVLVYSFLLWEATTAQANRAFKAVQLHVVDFNELRVALPTEIVSMIGERYPLAADRTQRLHATLNDIYRREHIVSLDRLAAGGKRDAKKYIESLEGMTPFVAARVLLMCFETHALPVDERLREALLAEGVIEESIDIVELGNWLSRQVKAGDGDAVHRSLLAWVDDQSARGGRRSRKSSASPKTKKKTGSRAERAPRKKTSTASRASKR